MAITLPAGVKKVHRFRSSLTLDAGGNGEFVLAGLSASSLDKLAVNMFTGTVVSLGSPVGSRDCEASLKSQVSGGGVVLEVRSFVVDSGNSCVFSVEITEYY